MPVNAEYTIIYLCKYKVTQEGVNPTQLIYGGGILEGSIQPN
jgi:hypothetical protein